MCTLKLLFSCIFACPQAQTPHHSSLEQPLSHLSQLGAAAPHPGPPSEGSPSWPGTSVLGQKIPAEVVDQIEVLKQQLRVYADDFATEREDRERNQAEKEKLKEELDAVKEQLQALEQQVLLKKKWNEVAFATNVGAILVLVSTVDMSSHQVIVYIKKKSFTRMCLRFFVATFWLENVFVTTSIIIVCEYPLF